MTVRWQLLVMHCIGIGTNDDSSREYNVTPVTSAWVCYMDIMGARRWEVIELKHTAPRVLNEDTGLREP